MAAGLKQEGLPLIRFQKLIQGFSMKFVVAKVKGGVDGFEGLKIYIELLLFAIICHNGSGVDN